MALLRSLQVIWDKVISLYKIMKKSLTGTVIEMDISHMRAEVKLPDDSIIDTKVGKIYESGDEIIIYDVKNIRKPWYLQGEEWVDENPISEAEVMRSY